MRQFFSLLMGVFLLVGCGPLPTVFERRDARCDLRPGMSQCTDLREFQGPSFKTFEGVCNTLAVSLEGGAKYEEDAKCDTTDSWGGCQTTPGADGSFQTNWYYKGEKYPTQAEAEAECSSGQSFVAPPQ